MGTLFGNISAMTISQEAHPQFHSAPPKRRGRPPGAKAAVVRDARALGVHHFAFLRSAIYGLDLRKAFTRYLEWSETTTDLRHIEHRRKELMRQVLDSARHLDATLPSNAKVTHLIELLRSDAPVSVAAKLPSLDEWVEAEGMDPDAWSEADLLSEYKAVFGLDNADALEAAAGLADPIGARVRALDHLSTVLAVSPTPADRIDIWFAKAVVKCMRNAGVVTLNDLVRFINVYGYRWHGQIKGFGAQRATLVVAWLRAQAETLDIVISSAVDEPKSKRALRMVPMGQLVVASDSPDNAALVALRHQALSTDMDGDHGVFRSHMPNTLDAANDLEAVNNWLSRYNERPSTLRSYRKEVERFVLWCARELKKPLSSVTAPDCQAYRAFLQAVPYTWINPVPVPRSDPMWRGFRGQPGPSSQKQALVIIQTMYEGLRDAGYMVANPMRSLMKSFNLPPSKMDIKRSFTEGEWAHVLRCLDGMADGPERLRLKCILELLVTSGIRLDELASSRHGNLRVESLPDLPQTWVLTVTGKRAKTRDVPLSDDVVRLLATHGKEFLQEDKLLADSSNLPLIRTLHASVAQWGRAQEGALTSAPLSETPGSALSASGIYAVIKRFFAQVAKTAEAAGLDPRRFEKASTHWMRHTFVRQALVDGVPIEVVSELAGHASIDTTSIYSTQELARKIKAVQGMKRRVAA